MHSHFSAVLRLLNECAAESVGNPSQKQLAGKVDCGELMAQFVMTLISVGEHDPEGKT